MSFKTLQLDFPINPVTRWGFDKPPHPELETLIELRTHVFEETLLRFKEKVHEEFCKIPGDSAEFNFVKGCLPAGDAYSIFGYLAIHNPKTYVEIGSGFSTRVARKAIEVFGLQTKIVSIDPNPRTDIEAICDKAIRQPLENCDLNMFLDLEPHDIILNDGSHRAFMNSDETVIWMDIVPTLCEGVLIGTHDIFLPNDYPMALAQRFFNEQYLIAAYLLGGNFIQIELPVFWISQNEDLKRLYQYKNGDMFPGSMFWTSVGR